MRPLPKKPATDPVKSDINVTPLVDVCLVLLIIFMVITPLMARGKEVPLPETSFHSKEKDKLQPVISIDKNEIVWLSGRSASGKQEQSEVGKIGDPKLVEKLDKEIRRFWEVAKKEESKNRIFMKVANVLPYGRVYPFLIELNEKLELGSIDLGTGECKDRPGQKCAEDDTGGGD
jgi:biopolymer transport protein TolR